MDLDDTALTTILTGTDQEAATALVRAKESPMDPRCFIVGRTGVGKSAARQHLEATKPDRVIRISPEDLSLPYITDLGVFRYLDSLDVHLDLLFIALWKHVLLVELLRHRYKVNSPEAKQRFMSNLREKIRRDPAEQAVPADDLCSSLK